MTIDTAAPPTISVEFVRTAVTLARETGVDLSACLREADIDPHVLTRPGARLTTDQVTRLTRALWQMTGDELMGLGSAPVRRGTFRALSLTMIHRPDLGSALERMVDVGRAFPGVPRGVLMRGGGRARLELVDSPTMIADQLSPEAAEAAQRIRIEFLLILWHRFSAWLIGRRVKLLSVQVPFPEPQHPSPRVYDDIFGVHVTFGSDVAALEFDDAIMASPLVQTEESLEEYLRESPNRLFSERDYGSSAASVVRRALALGAMGRASTTTDIATMLSISVPHLRRLLRQEGTSLGQLRDEVLRDAAVAGLERGETAEEISSRLGFSEPSAFRRAFKRWTGMTPGSYRSHA
ncbi:MULTISPECIES: AraC family transcriptional regulator [unclassified Rhodococcus (in: high G+C Gram-positive bacteria)]|jgi:AraC-like DNA-binding protein|uniref:AraC family transcriptional regulator n=1 Tax=unclassified Rhodococcus (in: high G+C Gram-positive bacteria) TaxID=192944 RepID=UPI0006F41DD5|nr:MULTISPECIES: AraC family transcriptional regulator [unclassified Rhodococcus (in: high G+C Gram-positive bacteria)]KQU39262.1 AraC family transcriptional regulator [Rhodococcus sp. Leaf225]KQU43698.1 AraC family transcriptional regulator [Rhodococcus sp. Leaf258]MBY6679142.1 AraC family transcriptional regulator [Rhodococcus sp. BP-332]MBY6683316.1 AraC family transcriptional regulator [Rhodococcus sp. BP-316]MBY6685325.1 AraC family transcriptional regulator [Rhodococcus sp. BP-288]